MNLTESETIKAIIGCIIIIIFSLIIVFSEGCATRGMINESHQIKIYFEKPPNSKILGLVKASNDLIFSSKKAREKTLKKLKKEARILGANGILLERDEKNFINISAIGTNIGGVFVSNNILYEIWVCSGKAILVME